MAVKKSVKNTEPSLPKLTVPRLEAEDKIKVQINKGKDIKKIDINNTSDIDCVETSYNKWSNYNKELLQRLFNNEIIKDEYEKSFPMTGISANPFGGGPTPGQKIERLHERIQYKINVLESLLERLELIPEESGILSNQARAIINTEISSDIFLVHGHDEGIKNTVARFLEHLDLNPIILHEQPNKGRTIIEKFENYSNVSFAVIILTPDDIVLDVGQNEQKQRARQNVIFELGFFLGKLGRNRVCALYKEGV